MSYIELNIHVTPYSDEVSEILIAQLAELGFESFMTNDPEILAYIPQKRFRELPEKYFDELLLPVGISVNHEWQEIEGKNWNEVWESSFEPILVDNRCLVKASFHTNTPQTEYEIIIDPKMSFGTGHHQTTYLMISALLNHSVQGLKVLDMGCGTGVLAILAEMRGAAKVVAIDNDEWAYRNTLENIDINGCKRITALLGDAALLQGKSFDMILANINLNILLADMEAYGASLKPNGVIFISGILANDIDTLSSKAQSIGLTKIGSELRDSWAMVSFRKSNN